MKKLVAALLASLFFACNQPKEKGTIVSTADFQELNASKENDDKRFAILGYPFIDGDITVGNAFTTENQFPQISFFEQPEGKGMMIGMFPIKNGKGRNEFYTPKTFTLADLIFYDNEGKELRATDKMQVSFTMDLQTNRERMKLREKLMYYGLPVNVRIDKAP